MRPFLLGLLAAVATAEGGPTPIAGESSGSDSVNACIDLDWNSTEAAHSAPPDFEPAAVGSSITSRGASSTMRGLSISVHAGLLGSDRKLHCSLAETLCILSIGDAFDPAFGPSVGGVKVESGSARGGATRQAERLLTPIERLCKIDKLPADQPEFGDASVLVAAGGDASVLFLFPCAVMLPLLLAVCCGVLLHVKQVKKKRMQSVLLLASTRALRVGIVITFLQGAYGTPAALSPLATANTRAIAGHAPDSNGGAVFLNGARRQMDDGNRGGGRKGGAQLATQAALSTTSRDRRSLQSTETYGTIFGLKVGQTMQIFAYSSDTATNGSWWSFGERQGTLIDADTALSWRTVEVAFANGVIESVAAENGLTPQFTGNDRVGVGDLTGSDDTYPAGLVMTVAFTPGTDMNSLYIDFSTNATAIVHKDVSTHPTVTWTSTPRVATVVQDSSNNLYLFAPPFSPTDGRAATIEVAVKDTFTFCPHGSSAELPVSCPAGFYNGKASTTLESLDDCVGCAPGSFCAGGAAQPTACAPGGIAPSANMSACELCPKGNYAASTTACEECEAGTYAASEGLSQCTPCPYPTSSKSGDVTCSICKEGFYLPPNASGRRLSYDVWPPTYATPLPDDVFQNPTEYCKSCPLNAYCTANTTLETLGIPRDYWRASLLTTEIYKCDASDHCSGSGGSASGGAGGPGCDLGHTGPLCEACVSDEQYFSREERGCADCPTTASWQYCGILAGVVIALAATALLLYRALARTEAWGRFGARAERRLEIIESQVRVTDAPSQTQTHPH